jgi:hypothetical protein
MPSMVTEYWGACLLLRDGSARVGCRRYRHRYPNLAAEAKPRASRVAALGSPGAELLFMRSSSCAIYETLHESPRAA